MKTVTRRIAISIIVSFALFVLNYNIIKIRLIMCLFFSLAAYFVIYRLFDDYGDDAYFDELSDVQIEKLSNEQLNKCMLYYERKIINARRSIKNPELKANAGRFVKVVDNVISCFIERNDRREKAFFISHYLRKGINLISKIPLYERQKNENVAIRKHLDKINYSIDSIIAKINRGYIIAIEPELEEEEDIIDQIKYENLLSKEYGRRV